VTSQCYMNHWHRPGRLYGSCMLGHMWPAFISQCLIYLAYKCTVVPFWVSKYVASTLPSLYPIYHAVCSFNSLIIKYTVLVIEPFLPIISKYFEMIDLKEDPNTEPAFRIIVIRIHFFTSMRIRIQIQV
jgi:hypothetical protein